MRRQNSRINRIEESLASGGGPFVFLVFEPDGNRTLEEPHTGRETDPDEEDPVIVKALSRELIDEI